MEVEVEANRAQPASPDWREELERAGEVVEVCSLAT